MFFIFGSSGIIGRELKKKLVKKFGNNKVKYIGKKFKNKKIDLSNYKIFKKFPEHPYKNVYILAAKSNLIFNNLKKEQSQININISIVNNVIKFCKKCKVERVFFLSSSAVYSNTNKLPFKETQKIKPYNSLGKSKNISEKLLKKKFENYNTKVIVLRLFTVYGNKMRKNQFLYQAIKKFKSNKKILFFWNKETIRNFIHIDDLIKIILKLTEIKTPKYVVYNIASNKSYKIGEVLNYLKNFSKIKKKIIFRDSKNNLNHVVSTNKIKKKIKVSFKDFKIELSKIYEKF